MHDQPAGESLLSRAVSRSVPQDAAEALRESEERFRLTTLATQDAIYDWNVIADRSWRNARYLELFAPPDHLSYSWWRDNIHPDDRDRIASALDTAFSGSDDHWCAEYRYRRTGGEYAFVLDRGFIIRDAGGKPVRMIGAMTDLSWHKEAEEAIKKSEQQYRMLVDLLPHGLVIVMGSPPRISFANATAMRIFGLDGADESGAFSADPMAMIGREDLQPLLAQYRDLLAGATPHLSHAEISITRPDGSQRWVEIAGTGLLCEGQPAARVILTDVTERRRAEEALRRSEESFRNLFENAQVGMYRSRVDGSAFLAVNRKLAEIFECGIEELLGRPSIAGWAHPERRQQLINALRERGAISDYEVDIVTPSGKKKTGIASLKIYEEQGYLEGTLLDITERKQADRALSEQRELLHNIISNIPHFVFWKDRNSVFLGCNDNLARVAGLNDPSEIVGKTDYDMPWTRKESDFFVRCDREVMESGVAHLNIEEPQHQADGREATLLTSKVPLRDPQGNVIGVLGIFADITNRKRSEMALMESEAKFRTLAETLTAAIFIFDEHRLLYVNPAAERISGHPRADLYRMSFDDLLHPNCRQAIRDRLAQAKENTQGIHEDEVRIITAAGLDRWIAATASSIVFEGQQASLVTGFDVTLRKQAEEALHQQALVFDNISDGLIITDLDNRITDWNHAAERIFGYRREEIIGRSPEVLNQPEKARAVTRAINEQLERNGRWSDEIMFVRADGSTGVCEALSVPLRDAKGRRIATVSVNRDVTERKRADEETRAHRQQLAMVFRLKMVGEVAAGLAHELNQPLSAISNYVNGCLRRIRGGSLDTGMLIEVLELVAEQSRRAGDIIRHVREFVRQDDLTRKDVEINDLVMEALRFVRPEAARHQVKLELQLDDNLPMICADPLQIEEVLLNLMINGLDAMSALGEGPRRLIVRTTTTEGAMVRVSIKDTGPGLAEDIAARVFDPLFTTKSRGMGIGLSISRTIIEDHGGRIWARRRRSRGAEFGFVLPARHGGSKDDA